ncbi:MAG: GNAT family N-acetyltransferase [Deltaproteobacteria bacterium]|nr:GNAT family N-acetyltransferase [Deltaproteobacteria bacterium]
MSKFIEILTADVAINLEEYSKIPCRFEVTRILVPILQKGGLRGILFKEEEVHPMYVKDYDSTNSPTRWATKWDLSNWSLITAVSRGQPIGGCVIAYDSDDVHMLEGRKDMSVLWDIRIAPEFRRQGIGKMLFTHAVEWSKRQKCRSMKIETQNTNINACRFYARQGCVLRIINRFAYDDSPNEVQLIWHKEIP